MLMEKKGPNSFAGEQESWKPFLIVSVLRCPTNASLSHSLYLL